MYQFCKPPDGLRGPKCSLLLFTPTHPPTRAIMIDSYLITLSPGSVSTTASVRRFPQGPGLKGDTSSRKGRKVIVIATVTELEKIGNACAIMSILSYREQTVKAGCYCI